MESPPPGLSSKAFELRAPSLCHPSLSVVTLGQPHPSSAHPAFHLHMSESLQSCSAELESQPEGASRLIVLFILNGKKQICLFEILVIAVRCDCK